MELCSKCESVKCVYGRIEDRLAVGIMEYRDPSGKSPTPFIKIMKKTKIFNILQKFSTLTKISLQFLNETRPTRLFVKIKNIKKLKKVFLNHKMNNKYPRNLKIIYKISKCCTHRPCLATDRIELTVLYTLYI